MGHDTVDKKVSRTSIATAESSCTTSQKESKSTKLPFLPFALGGKLCGIFKNYQIYMQHLSIVLLTGVVAILACALRGDIMLFTHLTYKTYAASFMTSSPANLTANSTSYTNKNDTIISEVNITKRETILPDSFQLPNRFNLPDLLYHIAIGMLSSQLTYHILCGFLQVYFYVLKRGEPEKWKCQPHRFLTQSNERHEIVVGTVNMCLAGGVSGFLTCWIKSGNYTTMYFRVDEYGYPYFFLSIVLLFLWLEATAYYIHTMFHFPWFYKMFHKHHHRYHSPTAYSAIAMSPIDLIFLDGATIIPLFLFPIHAMVYVVEVVYIYYFGLMDHSGIKMDSWFPWQPHTMFHDDHHRYFHCNFGFNMNLFDRLHGTLRKKDRVYGEDIFGGRGKKKNE